jgi:hypothetical protein
MVVKLWCTVRDSQQFSWNLRETRWSRIVVLVLWIVLACAQEARSVRGTVKDNKGHFLGGAVVQIEDRTTLRIRSYVTRNDGAYHFDGLSPDLTYHVRANYSGVSSRTKTCSKFDSDRVVVVDLTIHLPN